MTLLMAIPTLAFSKPDAVLTMQVLGVVLMLGMALLSSRVVDYVLPNETPQNRGLFRVLAFLSALAYYPLLYWSLMGMETGLLGILLVGSTLLAFKFVREPTPKYLTLLAVCLGLAWLTRNDFLIFAILIAAYILWEHPSSVTDRRLLVSPPGPGIVFSGRSGSAALPALLLRRVASEYLPIEADWASNRDPSKTRHQVCRAVPGGEPIRADAVGRGRGTEFSPPEAALARAPWRSCGL